MFQLSSCNMLINLSKVVGSSIKQSSVHRIASCFNDKYRRVCTSESCNTLKPLSFGSFPILQFSCPHKKISASNKRERDMLQILNNFNEHSSFDCVLYKEPDINNKLNVFTISKVLLQNVVFMLKIIRMLYLVSMHISNNEKYKAFFELKKFCIELSKNQHLLLVYLYDKKCSFTRCLDYTITDRYNFMMYFFVVVYMLAWLFNFICFFKAYFSQGFN